MSENEAAKVKAIFGEAIELPEGERAGYLERACRGDRRLLERVESLLRSAEGDDPFLRGPTVDPDGESRRFRGSDPSEMMGTVIGPYRIVGVLGEGGFGTVHLAEQESPVRRRVALKIIKRGMDTSAVVARFERERQALALMDHPNIAKVFDAGATDSGRPFFAMEYVEGEAITHYCDRRRLSLKERLRLFQQVCAAVQHAHGKGIIHRDIKPSNVLVSERDGGHQARVIDFGIAKATDRSEVERAAFTELRQMIGTPEYMSPEQAEGSSDIDTRTDVYSLGVLLYELLTGVTPFEGKRLRSAAYGEIQRIIAEEEPPRPSTRVGTAEKQLPSVAANRGTEARRLQSAIRGELDWIVMRALEKDRSRRYETASELEAEIGRFLAGQPVMAGPASAGYRLRKFARRNRTGVIAAGLVVASLVIGLIGTATFAVRESAMRAKAEKAETLARTRAEELAKAEALATKRADELDEVSKFQAAQLSGIDPESFGASVRTALVEDTRRGLEKANLPPEEVERNLEALRTLLARGNITSVALRALDETLFARSIEAINEQFKNQPILRARLLQILADTASTLGLLERAEEPQNEALAIRDRELGAEHPETLVSLINKAELLRARGKIAEAGPIYEKVCEVSRRVLGNDHRTTLTAVLNLGAYRGSQGRFDEAEALGTEAVEMSRRVHGAEHAETAGAISNLAFIYRERNQIDKAVAAMREALAIRRKASGEWHPDTLASLNNLGFMLQDADKPEQAEALYRQSLEGYRRVYGEDHPKSLLAVNNIASSLRAQGKPEEAEGLFRESYDRRLRLLGADHSDTIDSMGSLAAVLKDLGRFDEAGPLYEQAYECRKRMLGPEHPKTLQSMANLGGYLDSIERLDEAEPYVRGAYEARARTLGPEHADTMISQNNLAFLYFRKKMYAEAEPLFRDVLEKRRRLLPPGASRTLTSLNNLGVILRDMGRLDEAAEMLAEALGGRRKTLGPTHPTTIDSLHAMARVRAEQKRFAEAEALALESERALASRPPDAARMKRLATIMVDLYDKWEAAEAGKGHGAKAEAWRGRK
ncbi:MAG: tetratricopeptide repeat protein [Phycisphaerales bacterium]